MDPQATPGRNSNTPLRQWLREHLPAEPPPHTEALTWSLVQRYVAGTPARAMRAETGLSSDAIMSRFRTLAKKLGYVSPPVQTWLLPDGTLADHAITVDPDTGCWLWTGHLAENQMGPYAVIPPAHRSAWHTALQPREPVRRFLWERTYGKLPRYQVVVAICGHRNCVNLDHGRVRKWLPTPSQDYRDKVLETKDRETVYEAAARLGVSSRTIWKIRGPGGKSVDPSKVRPWLRDHLTEHQPADVLALDWTCARAFASGASLASIGAEYGVTPQMVQLRIQRLARKLSWAGPTTLANDQATSE